MEGAGTRINDACLRFEADWQAGLRPRIEAFLPAEPHHPDRARLLGELIRQEVEFLADEAARPLREDYDARFPGDPEAVARGFRLGSIDASSGIPGNESESLFGGMSEAHAPRERYSKLRDHARGGLGVVEVWFDHELHREVAVKKIHEHKADDPASRARFLQEGEITGKLEHPGIVPVYARGQDADGRLYYVMRLVRGESLKEALAVFHTSDTIADRASWDFALRKLLSRFIDVCNAIEYAHAKGILHRDLKPSNVMLGSYGETLVVDWGLAKILSRPEAATHEPEAARGALGLAETAAGFAMGTPAYMSPEQADGDIAGLGPASDIYSLGATLYAILTGQSPIPDGRTGEKLARARRGAFPRPRAVAPWIDPALEAVCLKAMQRRPEDRYSSCRAMANDVERWLADEPVSAWREPLPRRAWRFLKRHRTSATAAAVAFALVGGGGVWMSAENRKKDDATRAVLEKARTSWRDGDLASALELVRQAERFRPAFGGDPALKRQVTADLSRYRMLKDLDDARVAGSDFHGDAFDRKTQRDSIARAFGDYGINLAGPRAETEQRLRSSDIAPALASALLEWAILDPDPDQRLWLTGLARAAEPSRALEPLRQAIAQLDAQALAKTTGSTGVTPSLLAEISRFFVVNGQPEAAVSLLAPARENNPGDFWLNYALAVACAGLKTPRFDQAERFLTASQSLRSRNPAVYSGFGVIFAMQRRTDAAIEAYRKAIAIAPDYATAHDNLGSALIAKSDYRGAVASYEQAVRCKPGSADVHLHLGMAQLHLGRQQLLEDALKQQVRLGADTPESLLVQEHAIDEPSKSYEKALSSFRDALARDPHCAEAHVGLGTILRERGEHGSAAWAFARALLAKPSLKSARLGLKEAIATMVRLRQASASNPT